MIALLTTKTSHHCFFQNQLFKKYKNLITVYETDFVKPKFNTNINFEKKRDDYEKEFFFNKKKFSFHGRNLKVKNINSINTRKILKKNKVKIVIVFGTRRIQSNLISQFRRSIYNLHGGNPEEFRGLDSHYWSIYHNNFNLYSCLHKLNNKLDDGSIIFLKRLSLKKKLKIYQLRSVNTLTCIKISLKLIKKLLSKNKLKEKKQKKIGRYYSFMPAELKKIVEQKFNKKMK